MWSPYLGDSGITTGGTQEALKNAIKDLVQAGSPVDQIVQWAQQYANNPYAPALTPLAGLGASAMTASPSPAPGQDGGMSVSPSALSLSTGGSPTFQENMGYSMSPFNDGLGLSAPAQSSVSAGPFTPLMDQLLQKALTNPDHTY